MKIEGTVFDTTNNQAVKGAVIMAVRLSDSTLVSYTRSKADGTFLIPNTPIDTFMVVIQYPGFGDETLIVLGDKSNTEFKLPRIILPPKSVTMREVVIYANKQAMYFKGDTILFTADSFKVKENATVEDLLKKLPGVSVDKDGTIKSRGKEVTQVLVDGEEFFGSDPTMATRNLAAEGVETVKIYDTKDESSGAASGDTKTVMDVVLKDEYKNGYFGKASAASDGKNFYEAEVLSNNFTKKKKISAFGLLSNTPKSQFNQADAFRYGVEGDNSMMIQDEDIGSFFSSNNSQGQQGFPQAKIGGFYYSDKPTDKIRLNTNYNYNEHRIKINNNTRTQYFLDDTTYTTDNSDQDGQFSAQHKFNLKYAQTIDSLTSFELEPSLVRVHSKSSKTTINRFLTADGDETRSTETYTFNDNLATDFGTKAALIRKFKKKDRKLTIRDNFNYKTRESDGTLFTRYKFDSDFIPDTTIDQVKSGNTVETVNRLTATYVEPLSNYFKVELIYDLSTGNAQQLRETFNRRGAELNKDFTFSNEFVSKRTNNLFSTGLIYETRKTRFSVDARFRRNLAFNHNEVTGAEIKQDVRNILPGMRYRYKFSEYKNIDITYTTNSSSPSVQQLQPVPDNSNPNFIRKGNPDLLPTFVNSVNLNYGSYSGLRGNYFYAGFYATATNNDFSTATNFDMVGRTVSMPINVDGNKFGSVYAGGKFNLSKKFLFLETNMNATITRNTNVINNEVNRTITALFAPNVTLGIENDDLEAGIDGGVTYNETSSKLNNSSNQPFYTTRFGADFLYNFKKGFYVETDVTSTRNYGLTSGYNIRYTIWNAKVNKKFLKRENLIIGLEANDMLNQNISAYRSVQGSTIVDSRTSIIGRYIMLRATYKFDNKKGKIEDDDDFF